MGMHFNNGTYSEKLEERIREVENDEGLVGMVADITSTAGYDNNGSTGPEMIDNGISLGFMCLNYHKDAEIFWAVVESSDNYDTAYYMIGMNEDDALRRLNEAIAKEVEEDNLGVN